MRHVDLDELGQRLGWKHRPTAEQAAVITFPIDEPAIVVAGAGSGKTETMARRVAWILASGRARPSEILGLTFTRKATAELRKRVSASVRALSESGMGGFDELLDMAEISTYNSFANRLFRDNALVVSRDPDSALLTDAGAWQLAFEIVAESTDPRLPGLGKSPARLAEIVVELAHELSDNLLLAHDVSGYGARFGEKVDDLARRGSVRKDLVKAAREVGGLDVVLDLVAEYQRRKTSRSLIEYSDQVALALRATETSPEIAEEYRARFRYVLLDEYQDTSVGQIRLLSTLFRGTAVMAVGDPQQSIYGWRGAGASNLRRFGRDFASQTDHGGDREHVFTLSTSWRNDRVILDVANRLASPLRGNTTGAVELRARPAAGPGVAGIVETESLDEETEAVASLIGDEMERSGYRASIALLFRKRKAMPRFGEALRRRGIPFEIVGLGGALESPEVTDVCCALDVIDTVDAGNQLIRLLTGSRWMIGTSDIVALSGLADFLATRTSGFGALAPATAKTMRESLSPQDSVTIVDALDVFRTHPDSSLLKGFSALGRERLRDAAETFGGLRAAAGLPLPEFVRRVEESLLLDVEVEANPNNILPRRNLDVFHEKVLEYYQTVTGATLHGLVGWLAEVSTREDLVPEQPDPEPGTVQLITIHSAKGLEWDVVVIPQFVKRVFPLSPKELGWLHLGHLPSEFRGDAADVPQLSWEAAASAKELWKQVEAYREAERTAHDEEERRLVYVAVTRARRRLILSCSSVQPGRATPVAPSAYLEEIDDLIPRIDGETATPTGTPSGERTLEWPRDPLGQRRPQVEEGADEVRRALDDPDPLWHASAYAEDVAVLLREHEEDINPSVSRTLPDALPASHMADFIVDPRAWSLQRTHPLPVKPSSAAALGTAFHAWVESLYASTGFLDVPGTDDAADEDPSLSGAAGRWDERRLEELKESFLRNCPWVSAGLRPVDVEVSIHLPLGDTDIPCKLDAVFPRDDGGYEVVDWKTGRRPTGEDELTLRELQLAVYRIAYAKWKGIPAEHVSSALYYVQEASVVRVTDPPDEEELIARIRAAGTALLDLAAGVDG